MACLNFFVRTIKRCFAISLLNKITLFLFLLLVTVHFDSSSVLAKRKREKSGNSYIKHTPEWERRRAKNSECRLGELRFALNETWSPNMGPPFGVWNCVKCTCTPVRKKRRIVAKVQCRNMKSDCPKLNCKMTVLPPGACCKVCQEEHPTFGGLKGYQKEEEDSQLAVREFAVLLNGRTSRTPLLSRNLATGRLYLKRGNLHFSFVLDSRMSLSAPTTVLFINDQGEIVEELEAQQTPYEINNGRLCGTWTRVPKQYRRLLMDERLWVSLPQPFEEEGIMGRISRYKGVDTEVFSSLLMPTSYNQTLPGGGTAIISVSSLSDSLHVTLIFNGVFEKSDSKNVTLMIELIPSRNLDPVVDQIVLEKVFTDINQASYLTTLGETSLRLLTRGKVFIRVWSPSSPHLAIEGSVTARASCNVFSSIITTDVEATQKDSKVPAIYRANYGAGWAILTLSNDGAFEYEVRMEGLPAPIRHVNLISTHRRKEREIQDLTELYVNGWINGTYSRPTFRDLDALLRGYIEISIVMTDGGKLSGPLDSISVTEALRSYHPKLLMGHNAWMAATVWVAVDSACVMHYDLKLAGSAPGVRGPLTWGPGIEEDPTWSLQLRENDTTWDPRLELVNVTLEYLVTGRGIAAHTTQLNKISLTRLREGASFLDLTLMASSKDKTPKAVLSSNIHGVKVPSSCLLEGEVSTKPVMVKSKGESEADGLCQGFICLDAVEKPSMSSSCIDDAKKVYRDGSTWGSPQNKCQRCMCTLGRIRCLNEPCPRLDCNNPIMIPGQCCASCPIVSGSLSEKVCEMANEVHTIGSSWHPFLAPQGFDTCVTCQCNVNKSGEPRIDCLNAPCPPLQCGYHEQSVVEGSCCRVCNQTTLRTNLVLDSLPKWKGGKFGQQDLSMNETERVKYYVDNHGGCLERKETLRYNGERWFPRLSHLWIRKCIACTCKNGSISCMPDDCPKESCRGSRCKSKKKDRKNDSHKKSRRRKKNKNRDKKKRTKDRKRNKGGEWLG